MSDFNAWLSENGKTRETATDLDEIVWLRLSERPVLGVQGGRRL